MRRTTFQASEIDRARRLLELGERVSIKEIRSTYRRMCKRWHPDAQSDDINSCSEIKEINAAYRLLLAYCENYPCSLAPEQVESFDPEKWWYQRFGENIRAQNEEDESEE